MDNSSDLLVIGSGIIGLATAYRAHQQGQTVRVIDSNDRPVGASIQNFGHACFTGQDDLIQPVAERARSGWLEAAREVGFWAAESGTHLPAMTELEHQVLREFAEHRGPEQVRLLARDDVAGRIGHPGLPAIGGAHLPLDLRVNPREVAPAVARWLSARGVDFVWETRVTALADGSVQTSRGDYTARQVVACPGDQLGQLFPEVAARHGVRVCTLVMSLIERPAAVPADLALLTGTSLARYDGFGAMPSSGALRRELVEREPDLVGCIANLMVTGIPDGLLIGDSHAYAHSPEPFIDEDVARLLLDRAGAILGIETPVVRQRWLGRYADSASTNLILERPDDRTTVAVVTSGIGMTLSFGIADLILSGESVPGF
ncbi:TIGR03364 family FAD-dependent oxidoreductase [Citricoccus sp.]|uniref:TIGR03364 family FAD-dependent oxidoreductase n=1 Tax=Citricoccus sp. TaxID=1978372 RepID=UPI0028BD9BD2|nr:TIGR03364 family FAD-dependent oxidoreductase [Citricoccus sp.]